MRTKLLAGVAAIALIVGAGAVAQSVRGPSRTDEGRTGEATQSYKSPRTAAERVQDLKRQSAAKKDRAGRTTGSVEPLPSPEAKQAETPAAQPPAAQQGQQDEQARTNVRTVYPNQTGPQSPQNQAAPQDQARKAPPAENTDQAQQKATPPQGSTPPAQPSVNQAAQQPAASPPADKPAPAAAPPQNEAAQSKPQDTPSGAQGSTGIVALNTQQQTQIGQTIAQHKVEPLSNVNFSIAIGGAVPRSVQLRALPADLASFVPQYRGYSYFVVEDEVVIVDPASHQIATIVPYTASARAETAPRAAPPPAPKRTAVRHAPMQSKAVKLDTQDREAVRSYLRERRTNAARIDEPRKQRVERVERSVTIERPREEVYEEAPPPRRGFFDFFGARSGPRVFEPDDD